jgi:hypothetical protein
VWRRLAFDTWRAAGEAIAAVVPDMAVSDMDTSEGVLAPAWAVNVTHGDVDISAETLAWIRGAGTVFYAWHWYGLPASADEAVADALALGRAWGVPTVATEFMDCAAWRAVAFCASSAALPVAAGAPVQLRVELTLGGAGAAAAGAPPPLALFWAGNF